MFRNVSENEINGSIGSDQSVFVEFYLHQPVNLFKLKKASGSRWRKLKFVLAGRQDYELVEQRQWNINITTTITNHGSKGRPVVIILEILDGKTLQLFYVCRRMSDR